MPVSQAQEEMPSTSRTTLSLLHPPIHGDITHRCKSSLYQLGDQHHSIPRVQSKHGHQLEGNAEQERMEAGPDPLPPLPSKVPSPPHRPVSHLHRLPGLIWYIPGSTKPGPQPTPAEHQEKHGGHHSPFCERSKFVSSCAVGTA